MPTTATTTTTIFPDLQKAKVDDGTEFAYIDSGPPVSDSEAYTTLVIVHGYMYTAQNFARLLPLSTKHNTRIIALNRRDYIGTTPFSPSELAQISESSRPEEHERFLRERGEEIAKFLVWVIKNLNVPPRPTSSTTTTGGDGGIALMGWSLGNIFTFAFMAHLHLYPQDVIQTLEPYLRAFFIYESGAGTYGYPAPFYHPIRDDTIPPRLRGITFGIWASTYYDHPYYAHTANLELERDISTLVQKPASKRERNTFETLSAEEIATCVDPGPSQRSDLPLQKAISLERLREQTERTLVGVIEKPGVEEGGGGDDDSGAGRQNLVLPDVEVYNLYGHSSMWSVHWGLWELDKDLPKWKENAERVKGKMRPLRSLPVQRANHFIHWDQPDVFLETITQAIRHERD